MQRAQNNGRFHDDHDDWAAGDLLLKPDVSGEIEKVWFPLFL